MKTNTSTNMVVSSFMQESTLSALITLEGKETLTD